MKTLRLMIPAALLLLAIAVGARAEEPQGPYVFKSSVRINTRKFLVYYPTPTAKEPQYQTNSWAPRFEFNILGPLEGGSQISVSFTKPDGTKWISQNLTTPETDAENFARFTSDALDLEKQAILQTGTAGMTITLSNALTKTSKTLFTGKFEVGKFRYSTADPNSKNPYEYYVNHDWELPIGQLAFDSQIDSEAPHLRIHLWFRGKVSEQDMAGYLYYKGKQIASTKTAGGVKEMINVDTGISQPDTRWGRCTFFLDGVAEARKGMSANNYPTMFFLDKNPGEYELKVLRDGKLARSTKFTIGADGKLVDNGLAAKNAMGFGVILLPVSVEPGVDPKADISKYKSQAYYGNPVVGFP